MKIVYKFPSRQRVEKFFKAVDNIYSLSRTNDWKIVATLDVDDVMYTESIIERISDYGDKLIPDYGISKGKVDSINRGLHKLPPFDVLICMSDDMVFTMEGFDEQIVSDMLMYFPDTDGFLHYPDGAQTRISTMNIVGREYFNRTGYIYCPEYGSVYCDQEETDKAKILGKYKFIDKNILRHLHPVWRTNSWDELYKKNESAENYSRDREVYNKRKENNFYL